MQRILEVAPGALTWTILIVPVLASFVFAPFIAVVIFLIDIYWLLRTASVVVGITSGALKLREDVLVTGGERLAIAA